MPKHTKSLKYNNDWKGESRIASVAGSIDFNNISNRSQISISLDQIEMDERELSNAELDKLFEQIEAVIDPDASSSMSPEQREEIRYIIEGLQAQIRRGDQNNRQILRRFLRFLDDRAPEISRTVLEALI